MDIRKKKNDLIGYGVRRLQYESRFERYKDVPVMDICAKLGMNNINSVLMEEIFEYKMFGVIEPSLN